MVIHVVSHEGADHVVAVIVQWLHPHLTRVACISCRLGEVLWLQLIVQESVSCALVDQDGWFGSGVVLDQFCSIIIFTS